MEARGRRLVSLLLILLSTSSALADSRSMLHFNIAEGAASETLQIFLKQSGVLMLYTSKDIEGIHTRAVSGDMTIEQALRHMLEGTDLDVKFEEGTSNATISRKDTATPVIDRPTDTPSTPKADVPKGNVGEGMWKPKPVAQNVEEVVVTGSLLHTVLDVLSPLQVVKRGSTQYYGYGAVQDMVQALPLSSRSGPNESYLAGSGNFTRGVSANLRGLGAGATLVLVDGHRQAVSGNDGDFVDLSGIPWSAVDKVEVLADGASAIYGSDAIAGVVNIIMSQDRRGQQTLGRFGATGDGASERLVSQVSAWNWSSGYAMGSYQYSERGGLAAAGRPYSASSDKRGFGGSDFRSNRASPGNVLDPLTLLPAYGIPSGGASSVGDLLPREFNLENRNDVLDLLPHRQTHSAFASISQDTSLGELFLQGRSTVRKIDQRSFAVDQNLVVPSSNAFSINPFSRVPYTVVAYSFVDALGPVTLNTRSFGANTTAGLKKSFANSWHLEFSHTYGSEHAAFRSLNQPDPARLRVALANSDPNAAFNAFAANSAAVLDFIRQERLDRTKSALADATFVADGPLWKGEHAEVKIGFGATRRYESLTRTLPATGSFSRSVNSAFTEVVIPIAPQVSELGSFPRIELSVAGRTEEYSDFGSTTNPRISAKFAPMRSVRVRGSWGTSFRAPLLVNVYDINSSAANLAVFPDPKSQSGQSSVLFQLGANRDLTEETASTWTAGLDFAPESIDAHASITYFDVNYRQRIVQPGPIVLSDILREESQWASVIDRDPTRADVDAICDSAYFRGNATQCHSTPVAAIVDLRYRNLLATYANGLDVSIDGSASTSLGRFGLNARAAYMLNFRQRNSKTALPVDVLNTVGNPLSLKYRIDFDWQQHGRELPGWGASLGVEHSGGYRDISDGERVSPFDSVNLALSYQTSPGDGVGSNMRMELAVANLFDSDPPFIDREVGYDLANATPFGRLVTLQATKRW